jgi:hypothetical protein
MESAGTKPHRCAVFEFQPFYFQTHANGKPHPVAVFGNEHMKKVVKAVDPASEELGRWLGRREAFAMVAGRSSAAEAESLRRVRDGKLYRNLGLTWDEFCKSRLGVSRQHIDRTLRLLDEFGPAYFHVAQMAHVTPDEYRAIAPHVGEDGVRVDGAVIALLPENSEQVSAAVGELLKREKPEGKPPAKMTFDTVMKRCQALHEALVMLEPLDRVQRNLLYVAAVHLTYAFDTKDVVLPEYD